MPFYKFNNFTGRLGDSKHLQPLYPISPTPLQRADPPKMIFDTINTKPVTSVRASSSSSKGRLPPKMIKTFELMQRDLDIPVYVIKGTPDKILNGIVAGLLVVGLGMSAEFIYRRAFPSQ